LFAVLECFLGLEPLEEDKALEASSLAYSLQMEALALGEAFLFLGTLVVEALHRDYNGIDYQTNPLGHPSNHGVPLQTVDNKHGLLPCVSSRHCVISSQMGCHV